MLLRRITKHITDQNWFAVFIDFLIVVTGVFIGIQVANWNAERGNDALEREYINRLLNDFESIEERLTFNIQYFDKSIESNQLISGFIAAGTLPPNESDEKIKSALISMYGSRIPGWQSATYLEMQSAGDINLLDSAELKMALREFSQTTEIAHTGWQALTDERRMIMPVLESYQTYVHNTEADFGALTYSIDSYDFQGILVSDEYRSNLNTMLRIQSNNKQLQELQQEKSQSVLKILNNNKVQ